MSLSMDLLQRFNPNQGFVMSGAFPVIHQLILVARRPLNRQTQSARGQASSQQRERGYGNQRLVFAIASVKVWRLMVIVIDRDDDSEETADFRHNDL